MNTDVVMTKDLSHVDIQKLKQLTIVSQKPTDTVRLCADDIMTRLKLNSYQDTYAIAMAKYGLQRGIDGSTARHKSTQQYYNETKELVDSLKAEVVDLQERKEAAMCAALPRNR